VALGAGVAFGCWVFTLRVLDTEELPERPLSAAEREEEFDVEPDLVEPELPLLSVVLPSEDLLEDER